jgi:MerR family mercuric resistance operon transcriptional regulator/MerR family gold-responsive transcriptional activator of gol and ges genes
MASSLTIGKVAKAVGVNIQTIRYYERRRLLNPKVRKSSGYRLYGDDALRRLRIHQKNAQAPGCTLREVNGLLNLRINSVAQCETVQVKAQAELRNVEAKVPDQQALARSLWNLIRTCRAGQSTDRCPILQSLEKNERKGNHGNRNTTR